MTHVPPPPCFISQSVVIYMTGGDALQTNLLSQSLLVVLKKTIVEVIDIECRNRPLNAYSVNKVLQYFSQ